MGRAWLAHYGRCAPRTVCCRSCPRAPASRPGGDGCFVTTGGGIRDGTVDVPPDRGGEPARDGPDGSVWIDQVRSAPLDQARGARFITADALRAFVREGAGV